MLFRRSTRRAAVNPVPPPVLTASIEALESTGPRKKILVVDDDPVILQALSLKLQSKGYQVVTATDGSQAIGAMRDEKPDLMVVDICFPPDVASGGCASWDGFYLTQWLRRSGGAGRIPAIFISGTDSPEFKERASAVGAPFFTKPIDNDQLLACIGNALSGKKPSDSGKAPTVVSI